MKRNLLVAAMIAVAAPGLHAQQPGGRGAMATALELERQSEFAAAADTFRAMLGREPGDAAALLGLERVLEPLGRSKEILPFAQRGAVATPGGATFGVLVRAWVAAGEQDSARATVGRWAATTPGQVQPWRDWVLASLRMRDRVAARTAVEEARRTLKQPDALAYEMAQLRVAEGNWLSAADEWMRAVRALPGYRSTAFASLAPAPENARPGVLNLLQQDTTLDAQALGASLRAQWGDPVGGIRQLSHAMPPRTPRAVDLLTSFVSQLRGQLTRTSAMARALAYEEIAKRTVASASSVALANAARAYQEAGDTDDARRVLALLSGTTAAGSSATETMIDVLVTAGRMEEAEAKLADADASLTQDDRDRMRRSIAWGWARTGNLDRAESRLLGDSTVEALALRGRIAVFRGDIKEGSELLRKAGPFVGSREEATQRTSLLALLQPIEADSLPALGAGLLALEQRDTARAAELIGQAAATLSPADGGAALYLLAGRLHHATGDTTAAEQLLRSADAPAAPAIAPVAELELARLLAANDRHPEARALLEHLILTYPGSAVVPEARRALDAVTGAVPPS